MVFLENVYMIDDPYTESPHSICLGGKCSNCGVSVCADPQCSIFYTKRFCSRCAQQYISVFPQELHKEIMQMSNPKNPT